MSISYFILELIDLGNYFFELIKWNNIYYMATIKIMVPRLGCLGRSTAKSSYILCIYEYVYKNDSDDSGYCDSDSGTAECLIHRYYAIVASLFAILVGMVYECTLHSHTEIVRAFGHDPCP